MAFPTSKSGSDRGSIAEEFFKGHHREVVRLTVDSPTGHVSLEDIPYVVGALCLIGRVDEAETTYRLHVDSLTEAARTAARFFLGLGFCRQSQYSAARRYFADNLRSAPDDGVSRFYAYQGIGFYRFFSGRLKSALRASQRSFNSALEVRFLYGKALASDLQGHSLIQTGQISRGLKMLEQAEGLAGNLRAHWLQEAIQVSLLTYRARFGIEPLAVVGKLQKKLKDLSREDIYSHSSVLLELAQQLLLRGRRPEAQKALNEACQIIYASQNRRHEVLLNLRYAYLHHLHGEPAMALNLIRNAFKQLDRHVDKLLEIKVRGLELRLIRSLNLEECVVTRERELKEITRWAGERVGDQILVREKLIPAHPTTVGEDPFGDLKDLIAARHPEALDRLLENGYYALLYDLVDVRPGEAVLYFDLRPDSLAIFDEGSVSYVAEGVSRTVRALVDQLARGHQSKRSLIENLWKYTYHPLRHDPLIYSAIAKLRKLLGERATWVEATENGYRLLPKVAVRQPVVADEPARVLPPTELTHSGPNLNHRQIQILTYLDQNEFIDARTVQELFKTSEMTASRDLNGLLKLQRVQRIGKARATKYARVNFS